MPESKAGHRVLPIATGNSIAVGSGVSAGRSSKWAPLVRHGPSNLFCVVVVYQDTGKRQFYNLVTHGSCARSWFSVVPGLELDEHTAAVIPHQEKPMRWRNRLIVVLILMVPMPALGQAIKPADLVGTWTTHAGDGDSQPKFLKQANALQGKIVGIIMAFDANGTYIKEYRWRDGQEWRTSKLEPGMDNTKPDTGNIWTLVGDTLQTRRAGTHPYIQLVAVKGQQLFRWSPNERREEKCAEIWERFDPAKPLAISVPRASIIKPADLVGTWVGTLESKDSGSVIDSLTLGADNKATMTINGKLAVATWKPGRGGGESSTTGTWELQSGDFLHGMLFLDQGSVGTVVTLKDGKLIPCNPKLPVFTRVAP